MDVINGISSLETLKCGPTLKDGHNFKTKKSEPITHTMYPTTTGGSVLGLMYDGGVMIAADKLGSYGSLARFTNVKRMFKATDTAVLACGGDVADYQFIKAIIEQKVRDDECGGYTKMLDAGALHCWLTRVLYNRRSKFDPLWLDCVVGGYSNGKPYLGFVDKIGTAYQSPIIGTGFGLHLGVPFIREAMEKKPHMNKEEAKSVLKECLKLLYYRDCRAFFKYQIADITADGVTIEDDLNLKQETNWDIAYTDNGY